jgi:hypothetical protein
VTNDTPKAAVQPRVNNLAKYRILRSADANLDGNRFLNSIRRCRHNEFWLRYVFNSIEPLVVEVMGALS